MGVIIYTRLQIFSYGLENQGNFEEYLAACDKEVKNGSESDAWRFSWKDTVKELYNSITDKISKL